MGLGKELDFVLGSSASPEPIGFKHKLQSIDAVPFQRLECKYQRTASYMHTQPLQDSLCKAPLYQTFVMVRRSANATPKRKTTDVLEASLKTPVTE